MEGPDGGAARQVGWEADLWGWRIKAYHFWLWWVTVPAFFALTLLVSGFNIRLLGVLVASYYIGGIVEDFSWFLINPYWGLSRLNSANVTWFDWVKFAGFEIPRFYVTNTITAFASWLILIRHADLVERTIKRSLDHIRILLNSDNPKN